jgi:spore protease
MANIRTDLALEAREDLPQLQGVAVDVNRDDQDIAITRVEIQTQEAAARLGKPRGVYVTLEAPSLRKRDPLLEERVSHCMAEQMRRLSPSIGREDAVLVAGLGNWNITPDSLGPKVVDRVMVTRHLLEVIPDEVDARVRPVCALAPGVLGITGLETLEVLSGVVSRLHPRLVIVVDALAARTTSRMSTTIQISNTGIQPGSGIGNKRAPIDESTLGVPVLSVGVPLVVYAATIVTDTIALLEGRSEEQPDRELEQSLRNIVSEHMGELVVTPKEVDTHVDDASRIVAMGLNLMIHEGVSAEEVRRFLH